MTEFGNNGEDLGVKNTGSGLLTPSERKVLRSRKMTSSTKAKICSNLDKRLSRFLVDLYLIAESEDLRVWREIKKYQFNSEFSQIAKVFEEIAGSEFNKIYLDRIRITKNSYGTKLFWKEIITPDRILDHHWKKSKPYYSDRIFQPTNILRGLKESQKTKELLMKANNFDIIPSQEENAIDMKTIITIIESIDKKTSKNSKCKTCGFKFSPHCPTCQKRNHRKFQKIIKGRRLSEYVWFQNINTSSY